MFYNWYFENYSSSKFRKKFLSMMYFAIIRSSTLYYSIKERKNLGKRSFAFDVKVVPANGIFVESFWRISYICMDSP